MCYWMDVDRWEWGQVSNLAGMGGLEITMNRPLDQIEASRIVSESRRFGSIVLLETMEEFLAFFRLLEELSVELTFSPLPPLRTSAWSPDKRGRKVFDWVNSLDEEVLEMSHTGQNGCCSSILNLLAFQA